MHRDHFGDAKSDTCPLQGCVAPNLANGEIAGVLDTALEDALAYLSRKWRRRLDDETWAAVLEDFHIGKAHLVYVILLKMSNWLVLPWLLCILGHIDEEVARRGAQKIIELFEKCPVPEANHRLTLLICLGLVGEQLRLFAGGRPRASLPELYWWCCVLALLIVAERLIEAPHGGVKKATVFKHAGPLECAFSLRSPDIVKYHTEADAFMELAQLCDLTKSMKRLPALLGLQYHPWLQPMPRRTHARVAVLVPIIYRCDPIAQDDERIYEQDKKT